MATGWIRRLRPAGDGAGPAQRALETLGEARRAREAGDPAAAARLGESAVTELRALVASGSRTSEPALCRALLGQAEHLRELSRHPEAVAAAEEAVTLARAEPERPQVLAIALITLARELTAAGRVPDAVETARESLAISDVRPDPLLAGLLSALATDLAQVDRYEEALTHSERAVVMWRALSAPPKPARGAGQIAKQHRGGEGSARQQRSGEGSARQHRSGEGAARQARDEQAEGITLGQALSDHAGLLYAAGRWADAIEYSAEAVAYWSDQDQPDRLAPALTNHAIMLSRVGRDEEALAAAAEADALRG